MEPNENILCNQVKFLFNRRSKKTPLQALYPMDIQFYENTPPPITAEQLIKIVTERITVLKVVNYVERNIGFKNQKERSRIIIEKLKRIGSHRYVRLISSAGCRICSEETLEDRRIDHTSFAALSLALIHDEQLYEIFQRLEKQLFKIRLLYLDGKTINQLSSLYNKFPQVDDKEKRELRQQLMNVFRHSTNFEDTPFFKVPLSLILGIINLHEIYFHKGIAFIPSNQIRAIFEGLFRENLEQIYSTNMNQLNSCLEIFEQSNKFREILEKICHKFIRVQQSSLLGEKIFASDIDELAVSSFPPCMRAIHEVLKSQHHLKHESRLQYTLFLKGIGLPVDEAIKLFKEEFSKKMTPERFDKEYTYYIEHAYGFRGNKNDYSPQDCYKIQNTPTGFRDCNGCLFSFNCKTDIEDLDVKLSQWKISGNHRKKIIEQAESGHCGGACSYYFSITNKFSINRFIKNPNEYFFGSRYAIVKNSSRNHDADQQNFNIKNGTDANLTNILVYQEFNQPVQRPESKSMIKVNKTTSALPNNNNKVIETSMLEGISNASTSNSSIDKKISKSNGVESVASTVNMINPLPKTPGTLGQNRQKLPKHYFEAIRSSMATFDELIPIRNIKPGSIITYVPKSLDRFNTCNEISSDESPVTKRKKSH